MRSSLPAARPSAELSQPCAPPVGLSLAPPAAQGSEASPAARNTLDSARIPRASKLLICGLFQKGRVLAQDGMQRSRAETWVQAQAAPGPERASPLRRGSPGLDSRSSRDESANKRRNHAGMVCLLFIHPPAHGSEVSPAARNTLDSARIPRASKLLICGLFQKVRVLAQDGVGILEVVSEAHSVS